MFGRKQDRLSPAREPEEFFEPAGARRGMSLWGLIGIIFNIVLPALLLAAFLFLAIQVKNVCAGAADLGAAVGNFIGTSVGTAVGSFEGTTVGISDGKEDGKEDAIANPETTAEIQNVVRQTGRLEVLKASVKVTNFGNALGESLSFLERIPGDAVFTVDFEDATIFQSGSTIYIYIPEPEMTLYLDYANTEKLAEANDVKLEAGAADAINAYINSLASIEANASEKIANYDYLVEQACAAAQSQVSQLVYTICGDSRPVNVQIR